jgi:uncharacterized protein with ACT and thioredoxin-like domain
MELIKAIGTLALMAGLVLAGSYLEGLIGKGGF